jgi:hypothetical protein
MLLESNFLTVTNIDFYAAKLGLSSKRLNQILKEKLDTMPFLPLVFYVMKESRKLVRRGQHLKYLSYVVLIYDLSTMVDV